VPSSIPNTMVPADSVSEAGTSPTSALRFLRMRKRLLAGETLRRFSSSGMERASVWLMERVERCA
jgi:hypothetical protein